MLRSRVIVLLVIALAGCRRPPSESSAAPPSRPMPDAAAAPARPDDAGAPATDAAAAEPRAQPVVRWTKGMKTPESVLYDPERDRYLVSNVNGTPTDTDDNGFIAELTPDGEVKNLYFIAGSKAREGGAGTAGAAAKTTKPAVVTLNAPKGMLIVGPTLYVTDINTVRLFDATSGAPKGELKVPGATFLNDLAAAPDGRLFVSDSGMKMGSAGFEPTGTDAVYVLEHGRAKPLAKGKDLDHPNGLVWTKDGLVVASNGSTGLYLLDAKGARQRTTQLPQGGLDGLLLAGDELLVSSWEAKKVYRGKLGGSFTPVVEEVESPADIGFDSKRSRVIVPLFMGNAVEAYVLR